MASHKDSSVLAYEKKLENNPVSLVFSRLADSYRKRGDIQEAIDVCSRGLAHHPDSITGHIIRGRCYLEQEKFEEATQEFISVIGRDRLNQAAIKMLADVYARQGMKDKAGDLYAYLFARDPDNALLDKLAKSINGTGKTTIYEILGFSMPKPDAATPGAPSGPSGEDIFAVDGASGLQAAARGDTALDQTMKFDAEELTAGITPKDTGAFAQTLQYDAEQLKPGAGAYEVEEVVSDVPQGEHDAITGDDISERMTMMFDEEGPKAGTMDLVSEVTADSGENAAGPSPADSIDALTTQSPLFEVSGSDISSRIDQLFGEKPGQEAIGAEEDYTQMFNAPASTLQNTNAPLSVPASEEIVKGEVFSLEHEASSDVSGEDVVSRMAEMFEQPDEKSSREEMAILPEGGEEVEGLATMVQEEVSEEARPGEGLSEEAAMAGAAPLNVSGTPEAVFENTAQAGSSLPDASISGDDIAQRLESIFEEEPVEVQTPVETPEIPALSDLQQPDTVPQSKETLFDGKDEAMPALEENVAINESFLAGDQSTALEATVIQEPAADEGEPVAQRSRLDNGEKAIEDAASDESIEATIQDTVEKLDDTLPPDEPPEMSGNDILIRLDELFPESMLTNEALSMVAEIPEGEKAEENVNQGFYTMSGENAETSQTKEPLLEKLDDIEFEVPLNAEVMEEIVDGEDIFTGPSKAPSTANDALVQSKALPHSPGDTPQEYSIPDHVLTPTLADIYFQQGQPQLAIEIYERLLLKDPDNVRIRRRIDEIKKHIALSGEQAPVKKEKAPAKKAPVRAKVSRVNISGQIPKPLAGVRIKKSLKKRPKER